MKKLLKSWQNTLEFIGFYLFFTFIMNMAMYMFGLFYYLDFNALHWSPNARGTVSVVNLVMLLFSAAGFFTWNPDKED